MSVRMKRFLGILLGLEVIVCLILGINIKARAASRSGSIDVSVLQVNDVITAGITGISNINTYTVTLQGGSYRGTNGVVDYDTVLDVCTTLYVPGYGVKFKIPDQQQGYYYPYLDNATWLVVAVNHDQKTLTLAGVPDHTHNFIYSGSGTTITATCSAEGCPLNDGQGNHTTTLTISAENVNFDGGTHPATLTDSDNLHGEAQIQYQKWGTDSWGEAMTIAPSEAGRYKASITLTGVKTGENTTGDVTASQEYNILLAASGCTAPTAATGLEYNGQNQTLLSQGGTPSGGTIQYAIGDQSTAPTTGWSDDIPTGKDAGTYYVWYQVQGDANHSNMTATSPITVEIGKKSVTVRGITANEKTYDGTANAELMTANAVFEGLIAGDSLTVDASGSFSNSNVDISGENIQPKEVQITGLTLGGGSAANYQLSGNGNQSSTTAKINPKDVEITAKNQNIYVGGTVPTLDSAEFYTITGLLGEDVLTNSPTLAYQKNGAAVTPDNTTAGTYDIVPSGASAGNNYKITYKNGTLTISEKVAAVVEKVPEPKELTYTGSAQELVEAGTASGGTMQYALGTKNAATGTYSASIPKGTDAGTYYVWYKAVGDNAHSDSKAEVISVTIQKKGEAHTHTFKLVEAKEPTCTEDGNKEYYVCPECSRWFEDATGSKEITDRSSYSIKATGHKWDKVEITKEATYDEEGIRTYTCSVCGETKTESIKKKERPSSYDDSDDSSSDDSDSGSSSSSGSSSKRYTEAQAKVDQINNVSTYSIPENHQVESGVPASDIGGRWGNNANADTWIYTKSDGTFAKSEWMSLDYNGLRYWYYFNEDGNMRTNWFDYNNERFYLMPEKDGWRGRMATGWKNIENKWYYFETVPGSSQGRLYRSTVTPDGHTVGADGVWNGVGETPVGQK